MTTTQAAGVLGTTPPTIRALIRAKKLCASRESRGSSFHWFIDKESVQKFLATHGRYDEVPLARPSLKSLEARLSALESREPSSFSAPKSRRGESDTARQLANARARIVNLEEALVRSHASTELLREAEESRAEVVQHLLAANVAAERADGLRRQAHAELEEVIRSFSRPGHPGELTDA